MAQKTIPVITLGSRGSVSKNKREPIDLDKKYSPICEVSECTLLFNIISKDVIELLAYYLTYQDLKVLAHLNLYVNNLTGDAKFWSKKCHSIPNIKNWRYNHPAGFYLRWAAENEIDFSEESCHSVDPHFCLYYAYKIKNLELFKYYANKCSHLKYAFDHSLYRKISDSGIEYHKKFLEYVINQEDEFSAYLEKDESVSDLIYNIDDNDEYSESQEELDKINIILDLNKDNPTKVKEELKEISSSLAKNIIYLLNKIC